MVVDENRVDDGDEKDSMINMDNDLILRLRGEINVTYTAYFSETEFMMMSMSSSKVGDIRIEPMFLIFWIRGYFTPLKVCLIMS